MPSVFITRPIPEEGVQLLRKAGHDTEIFSEDRAIERKELLEAVVGHDALLCLLTDTIDAEVMDVAGDQLKVIANYAVGYDNIDIAAAHERGIVVTNTPGILTDAVAEHAIGLMFAIARRIAEADRFTRAGKYKGWGPMLFLGSQLKGKTLGIVGLGRIGSAVAERAVKGLGMKVLYTDLDPNSAFEQEYSATYVKELDNLLPECDVITLHVPLLDATRHLINAERLERMKETAYLINTSRGPVIDETALIEALRGSGIAGAALDVFEDEPALKPGLTDLNNVVLTPHIASATRETRGAMSRLVGQAIVDVLAGKEPENVVRE